MKLAVVRVAILSLVALAAGFCGGCNRQASGERKALAGKSNPGPEESFKVILESFRRKIEDTQIGFTVSVAGSRSTMVGKNKVSYELIPPATPEDQYKAVITVDSQSAYSLRRSKNGGEESDREQSTNQNRKTLTEPGEDRGIGIRDPEMARNSGTDSSGPKSPQSNEDTVARVPNEQIRKYELRYDKGRWALVTKLNPDTERSIQFAFEQALATQI